MTSCILESFICSSFYYFSVAKFLFWSVLLGLGPRLVTQLGRGGCVHLDKTAEEPLQLLGCPAPLQCVTVTMTVTVREAGKQGAERLAGSREAQG